MLLDLKKKIERGVRPGFTLIELLVVVGIIAILMSLLAAGVFGVLSTSAKQVTEQSLTKLSRALNQHWAAVVDQAKTEFDGGAIPASASNDLLTPLLKVAGKAASDPQYGRRAKVIWIKYRLKQEFPVSKTEVSVPASPGSTASATGYPGSRPSYGPLTNSFTYPGNPSAAEQLVWDSSACLYVALKQNRRGVNFDPDTALSSAELKDAGVPGVKFIIDGWGKPFNFVRWDWNNGELTNPITTAKPGRDPQDPEGLLDVNPWTSSGNVGLFTGLTGAGHPVANSDSRNLLPFIQSAGPDKVFEATAGQTDDLYSYRLTLGGKAN